MNENDEDVVHPGIVTKIPKSSGIQAGLVIRHRQESGLAGLQPRPHHSICGGLSEEFLDPYYNGL
jgi:hypothetical protein